MRERIEGPRETKGLNSFSSNMSLGDESQDMNMALRMFLGLFHDAFHVVVVSLPVSENQVVNFNKVENMELFTLI